MHANRRHYFISSVSRSVDKEFYVLVEVEGQNFDLVKTKAKWQLMENQDFEQRVPQISTSYLIVIRRVCTKILPCVGPGTTELCLDIDPSL